MLRSPRIEYPGAVYHVMSRGQSRKRIVRDERDRVWFLETMDEVNGSQSVRLVREGAIPEIRRLRARLCRILISKD